MAIDSEPARPGTRAASSSGHADGPDVATSTPGFTLKISSYGLHRGHDPRAQFWIDLFDAEDEGPSWIDEAEFQLKTNFADSLLRQTEIFRLSSGGLESDIDHRHGFTFRIDQISYGSLLLDVSIIGIGPFIKFFFNNPDVVMAFLETAAPKAFDMSVRRRFHSYPKFEIYPNEALRKALQNTASPQDERPEKAGWAAVLQHAAQIPFLLPLILALAVLYVAASLLNGEKDMLKEREAALDAREKEVRSLNDARNARLEALTLDLVKQMRAATATPASQTGASTK